MEKSAMGMGILGANIAKKTIVKKRPILWDFLAKFHEKSIQFHPDLMFFNRDNRLLF